MMRERERQVNVYFVIFARGTFLDQRQQQMVSLSLAKISIDLPTPLHT